MPRIPRRVRDSDVTWIIALWRALHSADIDIEDVAAEVTAIFSQYLPGGSSARFAPGHVLQTLPAREVLAYEDSAKEDSWQMSAEEDECLSAFEQAVNEEKARETSGEVVRNSREENFEGADALSIHHYYFKFKGRTYCFELPALPCSPAAA
jgi:hypothetical protein